MSPRSKEKVEEIREESREKILRAAMQIFARDGYSGATIRTIAAEAEISQGLLYNYFSGKEGLLKAVYLRGMKDVAASFAEAENLDGSPPEKLEIFIRSSFRHVRENREFWQLSYNLRMQRAVLSVMLDEFDDSIGIILRSIENLLKAIKTLDAALEAALLFALIDGVSQHYVLDPENYPLEQMTDKIVAKYCRQT